MEAPRAGLSIAIRDTASASTGTSRFSRFVVRSGLLGDIRWVDSYYIQGWLATKLESTGQTQAKWRVNPKLAGASGCGGDIGTPSAPGVTLGSGAWGEAGGRELGISHSRLCSAT